MKRSEKKKGRERARGREGEIIAIKFKTIIK